MIPKEKAKELVDSFYQTTPNEAWYNPPLGSISIEYKAWGQAKECALIAVDEILEVLELIDTPTTISLCYWYHEVTQEIANL